ncbi:protein phosphatase 1 regulatory subunit 3D [Chanos chanos]|uniref:Protein phosphatase 1 regulatory subunit 3D n=1 Tax=Chanos chanos TaxID=29144 RepID=A0A6J2VEI6_CHACN|nr:protein phosphatase 1 regulatory subunit 3D-like [Chanos chanos]
MSCDEEPALESLSGQTSKTQDLIRKTDGEKLDEDNLISNIKPFQGDSLSFDQENYGKDRRRTKSLPVCQGGGKRVQFADALGLNLADVKHFNIAEDPCVPPKGISKLPSYPPLPGQEFGDLCEAFESSLSFDCLVPTFQMPVDSADFDSRVRRQRVALEKVSSTRFDVTGTIRVMQMDCETETGVRYTLNDWVTFVDTQAVHVLDEGTASPWNHFTFTLYTPPYFDKESSIHFAVYCRTDQGEFWDNNDGKNYTLKVKVT